jgi:hypothetical protein
MFLKMFLRLAAGVAALILPSVTLPALLITNPTSQQSTTPPTMLILRGIANAENPRGQLDDNSAINYARRLGFRGDVLDVAGNPGVHSPQVKTAIDRIHEDRTVKGLYGFSGGGYNARLIWKELSPAERQRIFKVIVIGAPGVAQTDFPDAADVLIRQDPPAGHLAGPKVLLDSLDAGGSGS